MADAPPLFELSATDDSGKPVRRVVAAADAGAAWQQAQEQGLRISGLRRVDPTTTDRPAPVERIGRSNERSTSYLRGLATQPRSWVLVLLCTSLIANLALFAWASLQERELSDLRQSRQELASRYLRVHLLDPGQAHLQPPPGLEHRIARAQLETVLRDKPADYVRELLGPPHGTVQTSGSIASWIYRGITWDPATGLGDSAVTLLLTDDRVTGFDYR